ncbi:unnamed protein product, partial [marine sediment metagenome]
VPASITTTPFLTIFPVIKSGLPTPEIKISAFFVKEGVSFVNSLRTEMVLCF